MYAWKYWTFLKLIKNLRNHLTRNQVIELPDDVVRDNSLPCNQVRIDYFRALVIHDSQHELKVAPHLNESAISPGHFQKMKVGLAVKLLSRQTAAAMKKLVSMGALDINALTSAWFAEQIGLWNDLMTSRQTSMAMSLANTESHDDAERFLRSIIQLMRNLRIGPPFQWKPVQSGFILATTSALDIQAELLHNCSYKFVLLGRFTQDALENLFSTVRFKNPVPTPLEFKNALRIIAVSQCFKAKPSGSYNEDPSTVILDKNLASPGEKGVEEDFEAELVDFPAEEEEAHQYLAGYVVHTLKKRFFQCQLCADFLVADKGAPNTHNYTATLLELREFTANALTTPSPAVVSALEIAEKLFRGIEKELFKMGNIVAALTAKADKFVCEAGICFPSCEHSLRCSLLQRFFEVRLKIFLKQLKGKVSNPEAKASRSVAMRTATK